MAYLETKNLTFTYALSENKSLENITFDIDKGEFILLFGKTGSGKSTLLKMIEPSIRPQGKVEGDILLSGRTLFSCDIKTEASKIAFVSQSPDHQFVTDKVWHELAFTLENLSVPQHEIRRRVAEMSVFFGMTDLLHKSVHELSGGQKQIVNLAAAMIAQLELLLLDEPTSQLDPIAAENFMELLKRIHDEFGTTILLSEHRLEYAYKQVNRCMVMEEGSIIFFGERGELTEFLIGSKHELASFLPSMARLPMLLCGYAECYTVREAKTALEPILNGLSDETKKSTPSLQKKVSLLSKGKLEKGQNKPLLLEAKNVWFRYHREDKDILEDLSLQIYQGDYISILGGNGQGKTTLISVLGDLLIPYRGKVKYHGDKQKKIGQRTFSMLPQNPQDLFVKSSVEEELRNIEYEIEPYVGLFGLDTLLKKHPYDLSGGQQQLLAIAMVIMTKPQILILDEPTKGLDQLMKKKLAKVLSMLHETGTTILLVSHDIEFCARNTEYSYLMFDGTLSEKEKTKELFARNYFYTSTVNKMVRTALPECILEEEVINLAKR